MCLFSCEKDEIRTKVPEKNSSSFNSKKIAIEDIKNLKLLNQLHKITGANTKSTGRNGIFSELYQVHIDTSNIRYISNNENTYNSYTFRIIDSTSSKTKNLLFSLDSLGNYKVFLIKYDFGPAEIEKVRKNEPFQLYGLTTFEAYDEETGKFTNEGECIKFTYTYCRLGNHPGGYDENGDPCPEHVNGGTREVICYRSGGGSGNYTGTWYGNSGPSDNTPPGSGGPSSSTLPPMTTPVVEEPEEPESWEQIISCINSPALSNGDTPPLGLDAAAWLQNNSRTSVKIAAFLAENECSEEAAAFAIEAIEALDDDGIDDGEVNWFSKIIKDSSFINTKADCVLEELIAMENNLLRETVDQFTNNDSEFRLKFTVGNTTQGGPAQTSNPNENGIITITFNPADLDDNSLDIAATILHESIHAELKRIVATNNQAPDPLPESYYNYLWQLHQYWSSVSNPIFVWSNTEHTYMANQHVIPIANAVRDFDSNMYPVENYMEFGWSGLYYYGLLGDPPVVTEAQQNQYANLALIPLNDEHQTQCDE